ncbi:hypothetical protein H9Y04_16325 [Streptomyces sp. TRM66268-LWL]|uniref:Integral membrane protein n=1 Tax=Streptomyces polyasparticus TaxID=2767826 RepID=A0ABR7SGY4_9ACTN|nr:hypothetical protein [Streptomyces polyasparticus]MBC9714129.1 hypothetical protein [Streptomyces polyasparticus]
MPAPRTARAEFRLLRAVAFATVCVALSAGGHLLASHGSVPLWSLGLGFVLALAVAVPLSGRARTAPAITGALAVGQLGLHCLFGLGQQMAAQNMAEQSLLDRAARLLCGPATAVADPQQALRMLTDAGLAPAGHAHHLPGGMSSGTELLPSLPMLLGHLLAALALGWLLRRGDLALLRVVELSVFAAHGIAQAALVRGLRGALALVRALRAGLPGAPETVPYARGALPDAPAKPRTTALAHAVIRRGPPADGFTLAA